MKQQELRCIHRHSIDTHPSCFRKGLLKREDWWRNKTIAYFDIETTDFSADVGFMLSWCLKYRDKAKVVESVITKDEILSFDFDKRVVKELLDELENIDILVTFWGTGFDIKFARTRALGHGYAFPKFGEMYHWDLFYYARRLFKFSRKSLEKACAFFGIEGKNHFDLKIWTLAKYGDKKSLSYIIDHNREDVKILQELHDRMWPYAKWIRKSI